MCATSATNVAQNVAQFYLYFKYKSVYVHENSRPWRHLCRYPSQAGQSGEEDDLTKIFALKNSPDFRKACWFLSLLNKFIIH